VRKHKHVQGGDIAAAGLNGLSLVEIVLRQWTLEWANDDFDLDEVSHSSWEHKENKGHFKASKSGERVGASTVTELARVITRYKIPMLDNGYCNIGLIA
jgi:hypothetical protein